MEQDRQHWSQVAEQWIAWARTPNHDAFWAYRAAFVAFVGNGKGQALDVGCGEGRVARALTGCGYEVTALDPVRQMIDAAAQAHSARHYAVGTAASLPFASGRFDLVTAYNVLMDIDEMAAAVQEIRRALHPNGQVAICIVHPWADRGRFASHDIDAPFVMQGSYFGRQSFSTVQAHDGLSMHFAGWSQPLESYAAALERAGLAITAVREPVPDLAEGRSHLARWTRVPLFLWLKARPFGA